jgi:hypothetical protein
MSPRRSAARPTSCPRSRPTGDRRSGARRRYGRDLLARVRCALWVGYLSSTGVYGDTGGAWVDEAAPLGTGRRTARAAADLGVAGAPPRRSASSACRASTAPAARRSTGCAADSRAPGRPSPGRCSAASMSTTSSAACWRASIAGPAGVYQPRRRPARAARISVIEAACDLLGVALPPLMQSLETRPGSRRPRAPSMPRTAGSRTARAKRLLGWTAAPSRPPRRAAGVAESLEPIQWLGPVRPREVEERWLGRTCLDFARHERKVPINTAPPARLPSP